MDQPEPSLITVRAAERAGIPRRSLARSAERGELVQLRRGVYVEEPAWKGLPPEAQHLLRLRALLEHVDRPLVVSHWSAAVVHGLPAPRGRLAWLDVTVPPDSSRVLAGVRARAALLPADDVVVVNGLPVTSVERTVLDVASTASFGEAVAVADAALHAVPVGARPATLELFRGRWERMQGRRASRRVPRVLDFADGDIESPGESISRVTMHIIGLPRPVLQQEFRDRYGLAGRADFYFPDEDVIGEMDGKGKYLDPQLNKGDAARVVLKEKEREDRLRALVRGFVRWGWAEAGDPVRLGAKLAAAGVHPIHP